MYASYDTGHVHDMIYLSVSFSALPVNYQNPFARAPPVHLPAHIVVRLVLWCACCTCFGVLAVHGIWKGKGKKTDT